jgi:hypothetical protein
MPPSPPPLGLTPRIVGPSPIFTTRGTIHSKGQTGNTTIEVIHEQVPKQQNP